jgi:lipopolysaccharide transport system ATP-binding protein
LGPRKLHNEFWALKEVSFEVRRGETFGIVGRNGSGKSTLLQIICGTLDISAGRVTVNGRVAALLELGSGFNPEFTGRENVYMNGAVFGLGRQEMDLRMAAIMEFADIGDFIDQPVKTYSSGMMARLAFAVQTQVDADLLIIDETLAVGDARFQAKCFERLKQLQAKGTSILFVSHSTEQVVSHCSRALLLEAGRILEVGSPKGVVNRYLDVLFGRKDVIGRSSAKAGASGYGVPPFDLSSSGDRFSARPLYNPHEYRWGDGKAQIHDFHLVSGGSESPASVQSGDSVSLYVCVRFLQMIRRPIFGVTIKTHEGVAVCGTNSEILLVDEVQQLGQAGSVAVLQVNFNCRLAPGDYFASLGVASMDGTDIVPHDRRYDAIHLKVVSDSPSFIGLANLDIALGVCNSVVTD